MEHRQTDSDSPFGLAFGICHEIVDYLGVFCGVVYLLYPHDRGSGKYYFICCWWIIQGEAEVGHKEFGVKLATPYES